MTDYTLSADELRTLALFNEPDQPAHIDPQHFAKLLSLALIEQKEGGPRLTQAGVECLGKQSKSSVRER